MGDFDPVTWKTIEAAFGPPAPEVAARVERLRDDVSDEDPYVAVKTIHDSLYDEGVERTVPSLGEPFVTAYLLEKAGIIAPSDGDTEREYRSLVARRPDGDRLEELFWERKRTLWWIGLLVGVHASLVKYWLYEEDIPLMERNFTERSMDRIRSVREST